MAAGEGSYLYLLGQGLRAYLAGGKHSLQLLTADGAAAIEAVESGRAHLGVASLETIPDGFAAEACTRVPQVLAIPKQHPLASRRSIRLKDLNGAELIVPPTVRIPAKLTVCSGGT
jgi:DNA-binding transcriptional LysR family regulator